MNQKAQHIAVMRLSAMGDVAMTVPVLRAFAEQNPDVKITLISRPFFEPFFEGIPNLSFFAFDEKNRHQGFFGLLRLFQDLNALSIDAFADLHNVLRSKVVRTLFSLSGKKTATIDTGRAEKLALTRSENKIFKPLTTMFERHAKVFEQLGFKVDLSSRSFGTTFPEKAIVSNAILKMLVENEKISDFSGIKIGIAPFAQYDSKVYPLDLMQQVVDQLAENKNYKILLFGGGKKEIELLNSLSKGKKNVVVVAGKLKLQQELQLISNLNVMLSMDSGNAHIAAMLGVKVITLWGATHPFAGFSPYNQPLENGLVADSNLFPKLPTSVFGNKIVEGYEDAMRTISVQSVVEKINSVVE